MSTVHRPYLAAGDAAEPLTPAELAAGAADVAALNAEFPDEPQDPTDAPAPAPEHGELWSLLDWSFWGAGMGDVFREPLADAMLAAVPAEMVAHAEAIMADFIKRREIAKTGVTVYQEQRDELAALRERVAELEQATPAPVLSDGERSFLRHALELAADAMASTPCDYSPDDEAALATLRKLAGEA